jgi:hypothetical protein
MTRDEDPDVIADPVYSFDMTEYLASFFKGCFSENIGGIVEACMKDLNVAEKEFVQGIVQQ